MDVGSSDVWLLPAYTGVPIWATGLQEGCGQPGENRTLQICFVNNMLGCMITALCIDWTRPSTRVIAYYP